MLVMHLCGCELVTMIFGYCMDCLYYWNKLYNRNYTICNTIYTALYLSVYQSVLLIVVDRVLAVYLVLKYKAVVTRKKLAIVYSVIWLVSTATGVTRYFIPYFIFHSRVWLSLDSITTIIIASSYFYIAISVYRRRRALRRDTSHATATQLNYQIPLFIICSFILTLPIPNFILMLHPKLYGIWFQVIWSLNWISDPLVYVICTKLQHQKDLKNKQELYGNANSAQKSQRKSKVSVITMCNSNIDQIAVIE